MNYGSLVWSLTSLTNLERIYKLQKKAMRIMDFLDFRDHTNNSFFNNKIVKFHDQIIINRIILAHQFKNDELPSDLKKTIYSYI